MNGIPDPFGDIVGDIFKQFLAAEGKQFPSSVYDDDESDSNDSYNSNLVLSGWDDPFYCRKKIQDKLEDENAGNPYTHRGRTPEVLKCLAIYV